MSEINPCIIVRKPANVNLTQLDQQLIIVIQIYNLFLLLCSHVVKPFVIRWQHWWMTLWKCDLGLGGRAHTTSTPSFRVLVPYTNKVIYYIYNYGINCKIVTHKLTRNATILDGIYMTFLSTAKQGDNVLCSVCPSVRPSVNTLTAEPWERTPMERWTDIRTDGHYQVHYLPASLGYAVDMSV